MNFEILLITIIFSSVVISLVLIFIFTIYFIIYLFLKNHLNKIKSFSQSIGLNFYLLPELEYNIEQNNNKTHILEIYSKIQKNVNPFYKQRFRKKPINKKIPILYPWIIHGNYMNNEIFITQINRYRIYYIVINLIYIKKLPFKLLITTNNYYKKIGKLYTNLQYIKLTDSKLDKNIIIKCDNENKIINLLNNINFQKLITNLFFMSENTFINNNEIYGELPGYDINENIKDLLNLITSIYKYLIESK